MHPVIIASGLLSASILGAAFGPRLAPPDRAEAAPSAQSCQQGVGYYKPGIEQLNAYDNAWSAFQEEIVSKEFDEGSEFISIDFEATDVGVYFYYITQTC